jgi:hypothetical protein
MNAFTQAIRKPRKGDFIKSMTTTPSLGRVINNPSNFDGWVQFRAINGNVIEVFHKDTLVLTLTEYITEILS